MIRRPPRSTQSRSSAASDVYKRQPVRGSRGLRGRRRQLQPRRPRRRGGAGDHGGAAPALSLIHISEPTRLRRISYAVFCLKKKKKTKTKKTTNLNKRYNQHTKQQNNNKT